MAHVVIPDALLEEIGKSLPPSASTTEFVLLAVREKLQADQRKHEFYCLSEEARAAIAEKGLTEQSLLADFEATR